MALISLHPTRVWLRGSAALFVAAFSAAFLTACQPAALDVGQAPVQTLPANTQVRVVQTGNMPNHRSSMWRTNGAAVYAAATPFFGQAAVAQPLPPQNLPAHPWLAAQGNNGMHADSYGGKATHWPAPLGRNPLVRAQSFGKFFGGECATVSHDSQQRLMSVCATVLSFKLYLLERDTLQVLAVQDLPLRASNKTLQMRKIMADTSGGAYYHLLKGDKPLIADAEGFLNVFSVRESAEGPSWQTEARYDLNPVLPKGYLVTDAMPDWAGNIWFITRQGLVGVLDAQSKKIRTLQLPGEEIQNSFSIAADGVYIVSDRALYRFEADSQGQPRWTWREAYENDHRSKPGMIGTGSGTTPTLLGQDFVAITDNASPRMHVSVYRRQPAWAGKRAVCSVPVFKPERSTTDNGMIGYGRSIVVTNNYGYDAPTRPVWTEGGISRIDINAAGTGCDLVWTSAEASQSVVPKLSTQTGLMYIYTREPVPGYDAREDPAYAWYLTALDFRTGATRFKLLTGTGLHYNNNWAPITLSPWGTAYVGVLGGLVAVKDGVAVP